ncbi:MAG: DDE-type integrase/transposase/recombinase [Hyphomonas sp.]
MKQSPQWRWRLDEVFVKVRGPTHYRWRAVDHEGEVLESFLTKARDKSSGVNRSRPEACSSVKKRRLVRINLTPP